MISRISVLAQARAYLRPETGMTTLTTTPLAPLLDRLFDEADAASAETEAAVADLSDEARARLIRSKTDYLDLYGP
jgi:hypothetical protein